MFQILTNWPKLDSIKLDHYWEDFHRILCILISINLKPKIQDRNKVKNLPPSMLYSYKSLMVELKIIFYKSVITDVQNQK